MHNKIHLWGTHGTTILGITLTLFMLGILLVIEYHTYRLTHDAQERITYKIDLAPDTNDTLALHLKQHIEKLPQVKHVDYISRQRAAEIFTEDLGEDFTAFIGYNPLQPSLMVNLHAPALPETNTLEPLRQHLAGQPGIAGITYQENIVSELQDLFHNLTWILLILVALLLLVTLLLISSLIRIAIHNHHQTIATMRLVGAKATFIAHPFLTRSIAYGTLGGLLASLLTAITLWALSNQFSIDLLAPTHLTGYALIAASLTLAGIIISYLSTAITLHRHITRQ